jgi:DNA-binding response OmpR family regulator
VATHGASTESIRILVADGDEDARDGICLMLEDETHHVTAASDSTRTLQLMSNQRPHVVLLDADLPDLGGFEVARRIKTRWPDAKVIILTVFDQYLDDALAAGADGYVLKGESSANLHASIRRVLHDSKWQSNDAPTGSGRLGG